MHAGPRIAACCRRRTEHGDRDVLADLLEQDLERRPDLEGVEVAVDDVGHHARALFQIDDGRHVRNPLTERREVVAAHDRPGVERRPPARFGPLDVGAPARGTKRPGIEVVATAVAAMADEERALPGRVPERLGLGIGRRQVEARAGRGHQPRVGSAAIATPLIFASPLSFTTEHSRSMRCSPCSSYFFCTVTFVVRVSPGQVCLVNRTLYSRRLPTPMKSVSALPRIPAVNIPCPNTLGSPESLALTSSWCIGLKSPDAPAYITRSVRESSWENSGPVSPSLMSSKNSVCSAISIELPVL